MLSALCWNHTGEKLGSEFKCGFQISEPSDTDLALLAARIIFKLRRASQECAMDLDSIGHKGN